MATKESFCPLLYAASSTCTPMRYFTGIKVGDPFLAFGSGGRRFGVFSALEIGRARKESSLDEVLSLNALQAEALEGLSTKNAALKKSPLVAIILLLAKRYNIKAFTIPSDFPAGLALQLVEYGQKLSIRSDPFFPEQMIKSPEEVKAIREGNRLATLGIKTAQRMIKEATVQGRRLIYNGRTLTSLHVREAIEQAVYLAGGLTECIVAGGNEACDPHNQGTLPLRPGELIIVDVFPKIRATGYHGDMSRTFIKGKASDAQKKLVRAVHGAQKAALASLKAGITGAQVHKTAADYFEKNGYETDLTSPTPSGFIHSTGHGLGLELHEPIRISKTGSKLLAGNVITIEPGLYYPGLGGARIEDVVLIEPGGYTLLSHCPYILEI